MGKKTARNGLKKRRLGIAKREHEQHLTRERPAREPGQQTAYEHMNEECTRQPQAAGKRAEEERGHMDTGHGFAAATMQLVYERFFSDAPAAVAELLCASALYLRAELLQMAIGSNVTGSESSANASQELCKHTNSDKR